MFNTFAAGALLSFDLVMAAVVSFLFMMHSALPMMLDSDDIVLTLAGTLLTIVTAVVCVSSALGAVWPWL